MLSHAVCFSAFLDSLFCKRAYPPQGYARFFILYTPISYGLWIQDKGSFVLQTPVSGTATYAYSSGTYSATPGTHYIPNVLFNELIRLNYYGIPDFSGDQGSIRGV